MVNSIVRKTGVDALVYPAHNVSASWLCSLKILHSDLQLTFSLEHIRSVNNEGEIPYVTLRYEGDNLVPGSMSLEDRDINVPAKDLSKIARQGSPEFQILSITLKQRCSVWYREQNLNIGMNFRRFLTLARATEVCICFDTQWLAENATMFQEIIRVSQQFARLPPTARFTQANTKAPWSFLTFIPDAEPRARVSSEEPGSGIVSSIEDTGAEAPPFEDAQYDNPPPYARVSGKRSRHTGSSSTPDAHDTKRPREHSCPSAERDAPAPSLHAVSPASSNATVAVDLFQEAVNFAVEKALSHKLKKELFKKELRENLWKKKMTQVVMKVLPQVLEELLRKTSAGHDDPTHHPTLSTIIEGAIASVHESYVEELQEIVNTGINELEEYGVELKGGLAAREEDHLASCNEEMNSMLAEFKQRLEEHLGVFEAHVENIVFQTEDRLNAIGAQAVRKRGDVLIASKQSQRAMSLPISKGDKEIEKGA